jgi:subtilisin family serine protease
VLATGARHFGGAGEAFVVYANRTQLVAMAHILDVGWIEPFAFREKHNEYAGLIVGANTAHSNGYNGAGQTVAIADTGLGTGTPIGAHRGIDPGRIAAIHDWVGAGDPSCFDVIDDGPHDVDSGHGTHVAVSAVGAGNANGAGEGTAPGASLIFQAVENLVQSIGVCAEIFESGYYLFGIPYDIRQLFQQAYDGGARIHSDSWGTPTNPGAYDIDSLYVDDFIWSHPDMTITYSAGNSGDDFDHDGYADTAVLTGPDERYYLSTPATAKNLITVGASENDRQGDYQCDAIATNCSGMNDIFWYGWAWPLEFDVGPIASDLTAGNPEQMAGFSSRGPTHDNRIKPDIVAPGTWILSGYSDMYQEYYDATPNPETGAWQSGGWFDPLDAEYKYFGGTSMATPLVAGGAAIVRQYYASKHGHNASAALVKATLINSAVDLLDENNDGVNDNDVPIPNSHEGWGRMDLDAATDGSHTFEDVDASGGLGTGGSRTFDYTVSESASSFKVSLVWSDYPSTETAASNLVNDLDLRVTGPGGQTYFGNVFSEGWSEAGGSADRANNVENVYIAWPTAGAWKVTVSGFNVPSGPQPYALVVDLLPVENANRTDRLLLWKMLFRRERLQVDPDEIDGARK